MQSKPYLLVLEDCSITGFTIKEMLKDYVECIVVSSVAQAFESLEYLTCVGAFIDVNLPDGSGLFVLSYIRNVFPDMFTAVVTADDSIQCSADALSLGADAVVLKPLDAEKLKYTLTSLLSRQASIVNSPVVGSVFPGSVASNFDRIRLSMAEMYVSQLSASYDVDVEDASLEAYEKKYIVDVLQKNKWNVAQASVVLKVSAATIYRKLKKWKIPTLVG